MAKNGLKMGSAAAAAAVAAAAPAAYEISFPLF